MKKAIKPLAMLAASLAASLQACGGEVRYLAANGNDDNDGKTPSTAWRTVERLNAGLPGGGTALLRCGDVFYGNISLKGGADSAHRTTITSFGDGPKPVISCVKILRDDPGMWRASNLSAIYNQWSMDLANPSNYTGLVSADANPGFLLVDGEVKPWKRFSRHDVNAQWDFAGEDGRLYVYSTNNPALLAHDIRVAVNVRGINLASHMAVSNIAVRTTGAHGMCAGWSQTPSVDMRVSDCTFENIGGSELIGRREIRVRYGNGVEFGSNCADAIVERCEFRGIYDVAFTMQGVPHATGWNDIHMRDCLVADSTQAFEIWCRGASPGVGFKRCSFTGNRTVNVGGGWLSARAASPVWEFLAGKGLGLDDWPEPYDDCAVGPPFGYVRRTEEHGLSPYDWKWALDFADKALSASQKIERVGDTPHGTRILQDFPRFQPSERPRDRVEAPRSGCFRAGTATRRHERKENGKA